MYLIASFALSWLMSCMGGPNLLTLITFCEGFGKQIRSTEGSYQQWKTSDYQGNKRLE